MTGPGAAGLPGGLGDLTSSPVGPSATAAQVGEPSPGPTPVPGGDLEPWQVSPGLLGFVPVFLIALACVGLFLSLTRHLRRVTVRQALRDAEDRAAAERGAEPGAAPGAEGPAGDDAPRGR